MPLSMPLVVLEDADMQEAQPDQAQVGPDLNCDLELHP